jgi:hypothetical protein
MVNGAEPKGATMKMENKQKSIRCPIDLFSEQEAKIERLTEAINHAPTATEKAPLAQDLIEAVDVLLACEQYDEENVSCRLCRNFSKLRRKTAALIIKAGSLER